MVIINPLPLAPAVGRSYNHITPFTYRDGLTYIEVLETLRAYIRDVLVPHVDGSFDELEDFVNTTIDNNVEWTQEQIADLTDYVNAQVALIINDSIEVQDPVVAGLISSPSQSQSALITAVDKMVDRSETDYVSILASKSRYNSLFIRKSGSGNNASFEVSAMGGGKHVTATFNETETGDQYHRIYQTWEGGVTYNYANDVSYQHADLSRSGVWVEADGSTAYTTETGATFTIVLTMTNNANGVAIRTYKDNRGGMWELTLTGNGESRSEQYSTWISTAGYSQRTVFGGLDAGVYTLRGRFIGDDPDHAPTGGVARGWLAFVDSANANTNRFSVITLSATPVASRDTLLSPVSNWDFAVLSHPVTASVSQWVPEHNGVNNSVRAEPVKMYSGGKEFNMDELDQNDVRFIDGDFEIVQHIFGRHSETINQNNIEIWTSHRFHPDGRITITGKWRALVPLVVDAAYVLMLPVVGSQFDRLVTSFGNQYVNTLNGNNQILTDEGQLASSYAFISTARDDIAIAVRYDNPGETMRRFMPGKPNGTTERAAFLDHGDASKSKLYQQLYNPDSSVPVGTVHRFSGEYARVVSPGVGNYLLL